MKIEIRVPQLPESVSEAVLLDWHKKLENLLNVKKI